MRYLPLLLLALLIAACGGKTDDTEQILRFSAIPDTEGTELKVKFDKVAAHLSEVLKVKVQYVPASDYSASVEMFKNGDVQLAWFGGLTGAQARAAVPGARAIAQGKADPQYYSYFIAHKSTGLQRSDDFPAAIGKLKFTFGSKSSTSGRLMPEFFIRNNTGKSPQEFFGTETLNFSGAHDKTAELVAAGQFQVGALNYKTYKKMVAAKKIDPEVCRIIWKTPYYADYNLTAHPSLDETFGAGFVDKLQAALIGIKQKELLDAFSRDALIPAKNEDFQKIADIATQLNMLRG